MARSDLPIHPLIDGRYSPKAFSDREISDRDLDLLFEAARWAPSSYNEQPWRFLVVKKGEEGHAEMLEAMTESNRAWAVKAPVLILNLAHRTHERHGRTNPHAWHDLGLALGQLTVQASAIGIGVRHLAGILPEKARALFNVPEEYDVVSMLVIGFPGDADELPEHLREREKIRSTRKPLSELVHFGKFRSDDQTIG